MVERTEAVAAEEGLLFRLAEAKRANTVDRRYGVSGAQPAEVFGQVLERAWDEAHP